MLFVQYGGFTGRSQPRQTSEDTRRVEPAAAADAVDDDDDDDDVVDDPFDIPEESDDFTGLVIRSSPDRKTADVLKQTAELELESMSSVERKEKLGRGRHDGSADGQSVPSSRTGSGRRKVSIECYLYIIIIITPLRLPSEVFLGLLKKLWVNFDFGKGRE